MSNVDKLKKKAAEFEQKKQYDKALEVYLQIIEQTEGHDDRDVTVYNRVGDLNLRLNKTDQAVNYYEQAVDLYTEGGYLNNAIALCNKILRHAPARHQIYYKLGKISAKKGFNSDAKKNFLEYADRMHRAGRETDAFKALQEFADLCPGQDDIRLMLADQLAKAGKAPEAIEQLQILHESLDAEGRAAEAQATVQRIRTLDPNVEPRRSKTPVKREEGGLIFLDVGGSPTSPRPKIKGFEGTALAPHAPPRPRTPPHVRPSPEFEQLPDIEELPDLEPLADLEPTLEFESEQIAGLQTGSSVSGVETDAPVSDLEPAFDLSLPELEVSPLEGLESMADPSSFVIDPEAPPLESSGLEGLVSAEAGLNPAEPGLGEPLLDEDPLAGLNVLEDDRFFIHDPAPESAASSHASTSTEPEAQEYETLDLDGDEDRDEPRDEPREPEVHEQKPTRGPAPRTANRTPARKEAPAAKHDEAEEEEEEQEDERSAPKSSKPKLVEPLRMTRPKLKKPKTPQRPEPSSQQQRPPVNPFMRKATNSKPSSPKPAPRQPTPQTEVPRAATPKENAAQRSSDDNFVDLADWLREERGPRSTRMVAQEDERRKEGEEADFTDMLEKFKAGVAANVDDEDFDSHYDLGVAYKEMGLIDEAVAEFQKALRGATQRIRAYEALGQCFIERNEHDVAITVLGRALREPGMEDEDLIGVLYLLGFASEGSKKARDAAAYYQRVFAIDIDFRDVSKRLKQMTKAATK
ncbi:MAG TPA: tetratricopeptide repeat protein [Gemmatimonadaceae bacterium]